MAWGTLREKGKAGMATEGTGKNADAKGYRELCRAKISGGTFAVPAIANGRAYIRDDKELICVEFAP